MIGIFKEGLVRFLAGGVVLGCVCGELALFSRLGEGRRVVGLCSECE